jgi:hypothetical protein
LEENQKNRPATEECEMVGRNGPQILFAEAYPWPRGVEKVRRKKWLPQIGGIIRNGKGARPNGVVIVVGQFSDFIVSQSQSTDNFRDPLLQFRTTWLLFVGSLRQPFINRKKVALKDRASQRVSNQSLRVLLEKLVQHFQSFIVLRTSEKVFALLPKVRVKLVASVLIAIASAPHVKQTKQTVPNVIGIWGVYFPIRTGNAFGLNAIKVGNACFLRT